ncbi:MAG: TadE/TadG family type IV pilus assembly protein [Candidatus Dormibacteria bacterium]
MLEFALIMPWFVVLVLGSVDFANYYEQRLTVINAVRDGARYASLDPTAWSSSTPAPVTSIEGMVESEGGTVSIPNDDAHITIAYIDTSTSPYTECGRYSAAAAAWVAASGTTYTQSTCVKAGNEIRITVSAGFSALVPLADYLPAVSTMTVTFSMLEER